MSTQVGTRVGAILAGNETKVEFLGFGTYVGDEVSPQPPAMTGCETWEELDAHYEQNKALVEQLKENGDWPVRPSNPKIELDNGDIVWGQQCWWGPEDQIQAKLDAWLAAGAEIVETSLERVS